MQKIKWKLKHFRSSYLSRNLLRRDWLKINFDQYWWVHIAVRAENNAQPTVGTGERYKTLPSLVVSIRLRCVSQAPRRTVCRLAVPSDWCWPADGPTPTGQYAPLIWTTARRLHGCRSRRVSQTITTATLDHSLCAVLGTSFWRSSSDIFSREHRWHTMQMTSQQNPSRNLQTESLVIRNYGLIAYSWIAAVFEANKFLLLLFLLLLLFWLHKGDPQKWEVDLLWKPKELFSKCGLLRHWANSG